MPTDAPTKAPTAAPTEKLSDTFRAGSFDFDKEGASENADVGKSSNSGHVGNLWINAQLFVPQKLNVWRSHFITEVTPIAFDGMRRVP